MLAIGYAGRHRNRARHLLRSADGPLPLSVAADRPVIAADGGDLAYVTLTLTDASGHLLDRGDRPVRVRVSGPGVLAGFGSA